MTNDVLSRPASAGRTSNLKRDKELAKKGLAVTLGALVVTGFMRTPQGRALHIAAGAALIGLSLWHHVLYQNNNGSRK